MGHQNQAERAAAADQKREEALVKKEVTKNEKQASREAKFAARKAAQAAKKEAKAAQGNGEDEEEQSGPLGFPYMGLYPEFDFDNMCEAATPGYKVFAKEWYLIRDDYTGYETMLFQIDRITRMNAKLELVIVRTTNDQTAGFYTTEYMSSFEGDTGPDGFTGQDGVVLDWSRIVENSVTQD